MSVLISHTFTTPLLKAEQLILAALQAYEWKHQLLLRQELAGARDVGLGVLPQLLHGLGRMGLVLERPHTLLSEYMLSEQGLVVRHRLAQRHLGISISQISEPVGGA